MREYFKNSGSRILTLILAAGTGGRIGMPKWQLEFGGKTFLDIICDKLASVERMVGVQRSKCFASNVVPPHLCNERLLRDVICVKREDFEIKKPLLKYVINPTPKYDMISSVYYGVKAYPNYDAYLIWPVDHPFVEVSTIVNLKNGFESNQKKIIRPILNNIPGHPVIIPNSLITNLRTPNYTGGLRQLIKNSKAEIFDLPVADLSVLRNINLLTDFEKISPSKYKHQIKKSY